MTIPIIDQGMRPTPISARPLAAGAAIVSGLAWLVVEFGGRAWEDNQSGTYCSTSAGYLDDTAFAVATMSTAIALLFISAMLRGRARWLAFVGSAGVAASGFGNAVEHCVAEPFFLIFVAGLMAYLLATLVLAVTLLLTGALGRWLGLFLLGTALGLMLGFDRSGAAVIGVAWLAAGASLAIARMASPISFPLPASILQS